MFGGGLNLISPNIGERAAVIPNIIAGDVVSFGVAEDTISSSEQEVGRGVSANLLSDFAVNPSQSALRKFV